MATATQNDTSDLLILSDDNDTIKLDETPIVEENTATMDDLITFGDDLTSTTEEPVMEVKEEAGLDMGLDLTSTTEEPVMEVKEEAGLDMGLDLSASTEEISVNESNSGTIFSLEEATAGYVSQLEARKEQIANNIKSDEEIIAIKENKIKDLRSEISDYKKSIKTLDTENTDIDTKIGLVTGNTKADEIKSTTSTRVHNVKRRKAA